MIGWRRSAAAGLLLLAIYVGLSFLNSPRGFLGTDTGGKVATMKVMTERGRFDPDLGYWAEEWDPDGALHPIAFNVRSGRGNWVNVTTLPALWCGWQLYRLGGYRAALLVPMSGAVAAAFAGRALLRRLGAGDRHASHGFWLLGLGSPLAVYALDFWEHTLGVALSSWAIVLVVDIVAGRREVATGVAVGVLFGIAATMRTESLVYLAVTGLLSLAYVGFLGGGVGAALGSRLRALRAVAVGTGLLVGAAVPLVANELLERAVVGSSVRSVRATATAIGAASAGGNRPAEAAVTLVGLEASMPGVVLGLVFVALLAFGAVRRDVVASLLATAGAATLAAVRFASSGLGFVPGLGPAWVTPSAIAAWAGSRRSGSDGEAGDRADGEASWTPMGLVAALALGTVPIVVVTQFPGGAAPQWAGRYLLVSGFLLAVLGWRVMERRPAVLRSGFAALALAVTALGVVWLQVRSHDVGRTIAALESRPEQVVVSDVYHLAREGGATYGDKRWLTLSAARGGDAEDAAGLLQQAGIATFASVQLQDDQPLVFPGFDRAGTSHLRLFEGVHLEVTRWERTG